MLLFYCNSDSFVCNLYLYRLLFRCDIDCNRLVGRCIFECIGKQIEEYLFKLISIHPAIYRLDGRSQLIVYVLFFSYQFEATHHLLQKWDQIGLFNQQFHFLILNLAEIQNLIHQSEHALCVLMYQSQMLTGGRRKRFIL